MKSSNKGPEEESFTPFLVPLFSAILPFILWPIELILPYPALVEEPTKAILIYFILPIKSTKKKIIFASAIGTAFALSESILYISNLALIGNLTTFLIRLGLTIPLHTITSLIILLPALKDKRGMLPGILTAILVHYIFNLLTY